MMKATISRHTNVEHHLTTKSKPGSKLGVLVRRLSAYLDRHIIPHTKALTIKFITEMTEKFSIDLYHECDEG
jgi:hypothetical protein